MKAIIAWVGAFWKELAYEPDGTACPVRIPAFGAFCMLCWAFIQTPAADRMSHAHEFGIAVGCVLATIVGKAFAERA